MTILTAPFLLGLLLIISSYVCTSTALLTQIPSRGHATKVYNPAQTSTASVMQQSVMNSIAVIKPKMHQSHLVLSSRNDFDDRYPGEQNDESENKTSLLDSLSISLQQKIPRFFSRFIYNLWYIMSAPFPNLRAIERKRNREDSNKLQASMSMGLVEGLGAMLIYLSVGVLVFHFGLEHYSIVDSLYFACVCFSTVGYGDICPKTVAGKIFTCLFGLAGISLLGAAVASIGSRLVQAEVDAIQTARKLSQKRVVQLYEKMPARLKIKKGISKKKISQKEISTNNQATPSKSSRLSSLTSLIVSVFRLIFKSVSVVSLGGLFIGYLEGWHWGDSIYYSFITASTIGLGDFAPTTQNGRLAAIFFIPMAVAAAGEVLSSIGLAIVERRQKTVYKQQLEKGLSMKHLKLMDANDDGKVSREEYVLFMLMEMGFVSKSEVLELFAQFERLDVTKSGYLEQGDLELMAKLRDDEKLAKEQI